VVAVHRGDVVLASLDPTIGVEMRKARPVIVVSNDSINHLSQLAVVVPLTKNVAHVSPSHAVLPRGVAGLTFASKAVTEQVKAVAKRRLVKRLGTLPPERMAHVERALKNTLACPQRTAALCARAWPARAVLEEVSEGAVAPPSDCYTCPFSAQVRSSSSLAATLPMTSKYPHSPFTCWGGRTRRIQRSWKDLLSQARHHCLPL
jgi:mRNA interferase MazF